MKVDLTDLSPVKKQMAIEVSAEELDREVRAVLQAYARQARIPGFRPGKTPLELIRRRFGKEVDEDVRERLVSRSFERATREKGLRPVGEASLDEVIHESGQPFAFKTTFEVLPEWEVGGYKEIAVRRVGSAVNDEEVSRALEELRGARARYVYEAGRAARPGDIVVVDVEGTPSEGEPFRRERNPIEVGAPANIPEFNARLEGVVEGADIDVTVDYPANHRPQELAGKKVAFRLHVHEVKRRDLPELDDDFAREVGDDFQSMDDLRRRLLEDLGARKSHQANHALRQTILDKVLLANTVVLPQVLVDREVRRRLEELARNLLLQGVDLEKTDIDWTELRKRQEEPASKAVHSRIVLDAIALVEGIVVDKREVDERIVNEARRTGDSPERLRGELDKHHGVEALRAQLLREKTLDYLISVANIQDEE